MVYRLLLFHAILFACFCLLYPTCETCGFLLLSDLLDLFATVLISNRVESNNAGYSRTLFILFLVCVRLKCTRNHAEKKNVFFCVDSILVVVSQQNYYKACVTDTTVQQKVCGTLLNIATTVSSFDRMLDAFLGPIIFEQF